MKQDALLALARKAAEKAYAPYSHFRVGAAIRCEDDSIYTGVNVENRSFGLTICAERSAVVQAIGDGRKKITALAVSCPDADYPVSPCGACRQVLSEFAAPDCPVVFEDASGKTVRTTMGDLFPYDALQDLKGSS